MTDLKPWEEFKPKTPLGEKLFAIKKKYSEDGNKLLSDVELEKEFDSLSLGAVDLDPNPDLKTWVHVKFKK